MIERYFIFRINGVDDAITNDPEKAEKIFALLKAEKLLKEERTEYNNLTTTYNFSINR